MRVHIAGICGTFMAGVARVAAELGHTVGGCDASVYPPMSRQLEEMQAGITVGYDPAQAAGNWDRFIIGNALSRGNPLVEEILRRRLAYISGPEWLACELLCRRRILAVAGTHGKTTTTAMLAWILDYAGEAPGFLIGGAPADFGISARVGSSGSGSGCFVIEADEYDTAFFDKRPKFMHYHPEILVLNNLEFDHADIYEGLDSIKRQFHFLLRTVPPDGVVLYRSDSASLREVLGMGLWSRSETFSMEGSPCGSDWFVESVPGGFCLFHRGKWQGECRWSMLGAHNVLNAVAAIAAAFHAGVEVSAALRALSSFSGVARRLEVRGNAGGIVVYDDFAHHPTAIRASLEAVAEGCTGRVFAVFEPASNTMKMGIHDRELPLAFAPADRVLFYRPPRLMSAGASSASSMRMEAPLAEFSDADALLAHLSGQLQEGDRVVFMSSGSFDGLPLRLADALEETQS